MFAYCNNSPVDCVDSEGKVSFSIHDNLPQTIGREVGEWIADLIKSFPSKEEHYNRNQNNPAFPEVFEPEYFEDWDSGVSANCHQFTAPNRDNVKYVSPDGKYEAIYDSNNRLVTASEDEGTYNFASPNGDPIGHGVADVLPWIIYGNSENDSTKWYDRILAFVGIYREAIM